MITIGTATTHDLDAMVGLLQILFTQEAEFAPEPDRQRRGLEMLLAAPDAGQLLVAREGTEVIGLLNLLLTVSTALGAIVGIIDDLVVRPDRRAAGVGSALLRQAIVVAKARGCARLSLMTDAENHGAQRFYARHGFITSTMQPMRLTLDPLGRSS